MDAQEIAKSLYDDIASNPFKVLGHYFAALVYSRAGSRIENVEDMKVLRASYRDIMVANAAEQMRSIPREFQRLPDVQTFLLAAGDSEYCLDDEILRQMFANLLASCFDSRKNMHPSYSSVLKCLSPLDAQNFALLDSDILPITKLVAHYKDNGASDVYVYDVFLENENEQNIFVQSISIGNLVRLQLVKTDYAHTLPAECYRRHNPDDIGHAIDITRENEREVLQYSLLHGVLSPTAYGIAFFNACKST